MIAGTIYAQATSKVSITIALPAMNDIKVSAGTFGSNSVYKTKAVSYIVFLPLTLLCRSPSRGCNARDSNNGKA